MNEKKTVTVAGVPVTGPLTEVRTREHGTRPLPSRLPGTGDHSDPFPAPIKE